VSQVDLVSLSCSAEKRLVRSRLVRYHVVVATHDRLSVGDRGRTITPCKLHDQLLDVTARQITVSCTEQQPPVPKLPLRLVCG
jgi:hypothetical protein